jgi:diguanylate cyclase (GGDEF)-like protein
MRRARGAFIAGLVMLGLAVAAMAAAARAYETDVWWVRHTYEVRLAILRCIEDLAEPAPVDASRLERDCAAIRWLTRDNARQQERMGELEPLLAGPGASPSGARIVLGGLRAEERTLQVERDARARRSLNRIYWAMVGSVAAAAALIALAWTRMAQYVRSIRESEARTAMLLERGPHAVWALDRRLRLTRYNARLKTIIDQIQGPGGFERMMAGQGGFHRIPEWVAHFERAFAGERVTFEISRVLSGRTRYFLISIEPNLVDGVVVEAVAFGMDITTRKRAELKLEQRSETLHYVATVDEMTGVYNRRGFMELGEAQLRDAIEERQTVLVLFADLDGLKAINDRQGHAAGDAAIRNAASALNDSVRKSDVVGRLGGDEFVVLAVTDDEQGLVDRIEARLRAASIQMSIGVIVYDPAEGAAKSLNDLLSEADALMYARKQERKKTRAS